MKKTWKVPVTWEVCGEVDIEANSLEEAVEIFKEKSDEISLPEQSFYQYSLKEQNTPTS